MSEIVTDKYENIAIDKVIDVKEKIENDDDIKNNNLNYNWTSKYQILWENLKEDENGNLITCEKESEIKQIRNTDFLYENINKNIMKERNLLRYVLIIIDGSEAMFNMELRPSRFLCTIRVICEFVKKFFYKNPISQLGIAMMYNNGTKLLCPFMNGPTKILEALDELILTKSGSIISGTTVSLLNALLFAMDRFQFISNNGTKEVLFISANLTTVDPEDIHVCIDKLIENNINVSAIQLAAELYILKNITERTNGIFKVIIDETHFIYCLNEHLKLQTTKLNDNIETKYGVLIKMGFPNLNESNSILSKSYNVLCNCHSSDNFDEKLPGFNSKKCYFCPICNAKYCDIPRKCDRCLLLLVSPPYLTRSFMLSYSDDTLIYNKISLNSNPNCHFCNLNLNSFDFKTQSFFSCENCHLLICDSCKSFFKDSLGFCPGCKF